MNSQTTLVLIMFFLILLILFYYLDIQSNIVILLGVIIVLLINNLISNTEHFDNQELKNLNTQLSQLINFIESYKKYKNTSVNALNKHDLRKYINTNPKWKEEILIYYDPTNVNYKTCNSVDNVSKL